MNAKTTTIENITCECGTIFQWDHKGDEFNLKYFRPSHCPECTERLAEEAEREHEEKERKKAAEKLARLKEKTDNNVFELTPPRYQKTNLNHPAFNGALWKKVKAWRPCDETPFLGLIGDSGACKTRIAFMLFREIIGERVKPIGEQGNVYVPDFAALTSPEFSQLVGKQFISHSGPRGSWDEDPKQEARRELDGIRNCQVLLLDDLGKAKNTPSVAAELFAIIDHRHAHNLATIWTANSTPEEIVNGMTEDMAGPLAGRLIECSTIVRA
jgi:hypothetical protein